MYMFSELNTQLAKCVPIHSICMLPSGKLVAAYKQAIVDKKWVDEEEEERERERQMGR